MGHTTDEVAHVVLTHLDFDHVGGLADFPDATVHTTAAEHAAAVVEPDRAARRRYSPRQWSHGPRFRTHVGPGDAWKHDLTAIEVLPGIAFVPMPGHTKGHAAVVVDAGDRGLLVHAGDAVFDASCYAGEAPTGSRLGRVATLRAFEKVMAHDRSRLAANHASLSLLDAEEGVTVFNAHDKRVFDDLASR
jgi:glyoxylase-like metal-dependent hydrolase (beta-lactamase superfamily II)